VNILIAGAFGNLGTQLTRAALAAGHRVLAADKVQKPMDGVDCSRLEFREIDVTRPESLAGICEGMDIVISTVGLTSSSTLVTHYDIDLRGNLGILKEARKSGVGKFIYISVIKADTDRTIPMLDAKHQFEQALEASGTRYLIVRPTGYFYDIAKVFKPMVEKGSVRLLAGRHSRANVIHTADLADYIVGNLALDNRTVEIGGMETWTYEEIAGMFFASAGKEVKISYVPGFLFDMLALAARLSGNGKYANIKFGKWTLSHDMVGAVQFGKRSFSEYIAGGCV